MGIAWRKTAEDLLELEIALLDQAICTSPWSVVLMYASNKAYQILLMKSVGLIFSNVGTNLFLKLICSFHTIFALLPFAVIQATWLLLKYLPLLDFWLWLQATDIYG